MGQNTKYIITTEEVEVPINIVHFNEGNSTIFPLLLEDNDFNEISEYSKKSDDSVYNFFDMILYGGYSLEYPIKNLISFIMTAKIKELGIISYREIADVPQFIGESILFLDDNIFDVSKMEFPEDEIHRLIKSDVSFQNLINQENKYWSYESSEFWYLTNLNKDK